MLIMLLIGLLLSLLHFSTAPTSFSYQDERIIADVNKIRKGKMKVQDFEPVIHEYATNDFQGWVKAWSIIWVIYVLTIGIIHFFSEY